MSAGKNLRNYTSYPPRGNGSDPNNDEARKGGSVEAILEGKKRVAVLDGVRPDHEIGENAAGAGIALSPAAGSMGLEGPARDRKSTRLNSSHIQKSRMPSSA